MPNMSVQLVLNVEGLGPISGCFEHRVQQAPELDGSKNFIEEGLLALRVELLYAQFYEELPEAKDLFPEVKTRTYSSQDLVTGRIETDTNKDELWRLVGNVALAVKVSLAKAKAFHELQRSADSTDERLHFLLHLEKMDKLNLAVHTIATIRDLHMRIINEALGGVPFKITLANDKKAFARVLSQVLEHRDEIKEIGDLDQIHLEVLEEVAEKLRTSATSSTKLFLKYRNRLVHQEPQSVDDARLYPQLESREWTPVVQEGRVVGKTKGISSRQATPDWNFEDLFSVIVDAFEHYLSTLRSLRGLEAFRP